VPGLVPSLCHFLSGVSIKITSFRRHRLIAAKNGGKPQSNGSTPNRWQGGGRALMAWKLHKTIVLVGMMGAGKTAVGKALAQRLSAPFLDSDGEIERAAAMTIPEIFARDGEPFFRAREAQVIERLLAGTPCVLSTGGGAFVAANTRDLVHRLGVAVWLDVPLDTLWQRVRHKESRPLLKTPDPKGTLTALHTQRAPIYAQADVHVAVAPRWSVDDTTGAVVDALKPRPDVLEEL
jgi:shikimate kinase